MWYLNKVWSTNFVDDDEMPRVEKMISLANISNSLEIEFDANPAQDLVDFLSLKTDWQSCVW